MPYLAHLALALRGISFLIAVFVGYSSWISLLLH
jgi:hypothetical protein